MHFYRVAFFNEILDSTGHEHQVCQRELEVGTDDGEDRAVAAAIDQFQEHENVSDWKQRAVRIECVRIDRGE